MVQNSSTKRVEALDAFRGITAFFIMISHFLLYIPEIFRVECIVKICGWQAWSLPYFFILSGFVLTASYRRLQERSLHPYRDLVVNRIFRLYPVFIVTTLFFFFMKLYFGAGEDVAGVSPLFNISWRIEPTVPLLLHALTLVGFADSWSFNNPSWTLIFEMRYILFFPLFYSLMRRSGLYILGFVAISALAYHLNAQIPTTDIFYQESPVLSNAYSMMNFLVFYLAGVILAFNIERITQAYNSLSRSSSIGLLALSIIFAVAPTWCGALVPAICRSIVLNMIVLVGVVLWIVILINNAVVAKFFSHRLLVAFGRSSFSLYLWHMPIITLNYILFRESWALGYIIALSIVESIVVAHLSYQYIELPCVDLCRRLLRK